MSESSRFPYCLSIVVVLRCSTDSAPTPQLPSSLEHGPLTWAREDSYLAEGIGSCTGQCRFTGAIDSKRPFSSRRSRCPEPSVHPANQLFDKSKCAF